MLVIRHIKEHKNLKENAVTFEGIKARQVEKEDLTKFDYIIAMDKQEYSRFKSLGKTGGYIGRLSDFVPDGGWTDVPDPYYTGISKKYMTL